MKREYNVCLYLSLFPSALSPLHLGWLYRLKLSWCHCTAPQVKAVQSWVAVWRGTRRHQGAISAVAGLAWECSPSWGGHLSSPLVHRLHSTYWRNVQLFLTFSGKELSRGTQDQQILFRDCNCELFLQKPGKERTDAFCLSLPHPWQKAGPHLLVEILVHGLSTLRSS